MFVPQWRQKRDRLTTGTKAVCFYSAAITWLNAEFILAIRATLSEPARRPAAAVLHPLERSLRPEDILARRQVVQSCIVLIGFRS